MRGKDKKTPLYLQLHIQSHTDGDESQDTDYTYTETTWHVEGISLVGTDGHLCAQVDFEVDIGDALYVVYVIYTTGDSYGTRRGDQLELISIHRDPNVAHVNMTAILDRDLNRKKLNPSKSKPLQIKFDSGVVVKMRSVPWEGYFESLDSVVVKELIVK